MAQRFRYEFREGRLFLDHESGEGVYRIDPWPRPRSVVRLVAGGEWLPCPPPVRLLRSLRPPRGRGRSGPQMELALGDEIRPRRAESNQRALAQFRASLPVAVARAAEKFRSLQWEVIVTSSLSDRFVDLLISNPALAYLWLSRCQSRGFCQEGVPELLVANADQGGETNQRQLLRHLALRHSKAAVKLLRKCHLPALNSDTEELLLTVLRDPQRMQRLRHVPRLGAGVLELARSTRILSSCSPTLLTELAAAREELHRAPTAQRIANHLVLLDELGMPLPRPFRSRTELDRLHQELADGFHELRRELDENVPPPPPPPVPHQALRKTAKSFPGPPFAGTQHIIPLTSRSELTAEGKEQSNCVASYVQRVRKGTTYIYKVLWPERATLSIVKQRNGNWRRGELKGPRNCAVSPETTRMVAAWMKSCRKGPHPEEPAGKPTPPQLSGNPDLNNL